MNNHDKQKFQDIITKLDLNQITLADAKRYAQQIFSIGVICRTKKQFIKLLGEALSEKESTR